MSKTLYAVTCHEVGNLSQLSIATSTLELFNKLKVNNVPKQEIVLSIEKLKFDKIDDSYDYLLRMPIYSLTKEVFLKLKEDFSKKKEEIKILEDTDVKDMYLEDLSELKKKFK